MPRLPTADRETVDYMAGAIHEEIWRPGGLAALLPGAPGTPEAGDPHSEYQMLLDTSISVRDEPSARDIHLVSQDVGNDGLLLGLYTHPPAEIKIFANSVVAAGYDPVDVATHELGHRFGYDHSLREAAVPMWGDETGAVYTRPVYGDDCPVCLVHRKTAECVMLLDGLRKRAHLQHQIPLGLGGTIPLCAQRVAEARSNLAMSASAFSDRQGQVRELDGLLAGLATCLSRWLTPENVSECYTLAYKCWDRAYDLAAVYYEALALGRV